MSASAVRDKTIDRARVSARGIQRQDISTHLVKEGNQAGGFNKQNWSVFVRNSRV